MLNAFLPFFTPIPVLVVGYRGEMIFTHRNKLSLCDYFLYVLFCYTHLVRAAVNIPTPMFPSMWKPYQNNTSLPSPFDSGAVVHQPGVIFALATSGDMSHEQGQEGCNGHLVDRGQGCSQDSRLPHWITWSKMSAVSSVRTLDPGRVRILLAKE